jgi:hypothetical protein
VVLVEPGLIRTNLYNNSVVASKSQDANSLYTEMMRKLPASFEKMLEGGSYADVVAKVVLKAATSENPSPIDSGHLSFLFSLMCISSNTIRLNHNEE